MRFLAIFLALAFVVMLVVAAFGAGFIMRADESSQVVRFYERVTRKLDEIRGKPTAEELALAEIETTFIRFTGELYELPETDYINGGALTVWDKERLILVTRGGRLLQFTDTQGLQDLSIAVPPNGKDEYKELAAADEYSKYLHKPHTLRYNDITYVDRPDFHGFLLSYSFFDVERVCGGSRIARLDIPRDVSDPLSLDVAPGDWRILFETTPCLELDPNWTAFDGIMAGGRMALHPDGRLIFGSGEYHRDGIHTKDLGIQELDNSYGKVLAIDYNTGAMEILAIGHRNMQGVAIDAAGEIWTIEHAIRGGDELNHIQPGENAGWPRVSLGTLYSGQPLPTVGIQGRHEGYDGPAFAWLPSAATSALTAINDFHPAWDGGLLAGSLSSPEYGQSLWHIRTEGTHVVFAERIALQRRVRYVTQWGDKLALWLDPTDLLILKKVNRKDPLGSALAALEEEFPSDIAQQARLTLNKCAECHSFEQGNHRGAPSLNGVIGRVAGSTNYAFYSNDLLSIGKVWDEESIKQYLVDPISIAPSTSMPAQNLKEGRILDAVIWGLKEADTTDDTHMKY